MLSNSLKVTAVAVDIDIFYEIAKHLVKCGIVQKGMDSCRPWRGLLGKLQVSFIETFFMEFYSWFGFNTSFALCSFIVRLSFLGWALIQPVLVLPRLKKFCC